MLTIWLLVITQTSFNESHASLSVKVSSVLKNSLFQGITSFRSICQIYAFWVPISAVEGPHWVPISLNIRSPLGPHEIFLGPHSMWEQCNWELFGYMAYGVPFLFKVSHGFRFSGETEANGKLIWISLPWAGIANRYKFVCPVSLPARYHLRPES